VDMGIRAGQKTIVGLVLLALMALLVAAFWSATPKSQGQTAVAAKKKCKKGKKGKASSAKKKKCKKKKPAAKPAPLVRATLTWAGGGDSTDFDLWVFDTSGSKGRAAANPIPNTSFTPNATGSNGTEAFTDLIYLKPGRSFSYGVCYQDGGSLHITYKIDFVTADGVHHSDSQELQSDGAHREYDGGAPIPATYCKAP
jgi:hypothetical protein